MTLLLESPAFVEGDEIPERYTCQGQNTSPPLSWTDTPTGTESLALIVEDPDAPDPRAPKRVFTHWLLYNIPADIHELAEGAKQLPAGSTQGTNDFEKAGWGGPCPPRGRHRYFFRLYALDQRLPPLNNPHKAELLEAMRGHVLGEAVLMGTYEKH